MKISLRAKFIISFTIVVVLTGAVSTWIGIHLIGNGVIGEAQRRVEMDLNAAREIYNWEVRCVSHVIRLTSNRFFIKEDFLKGKTEDLFRKFEAIRVKEGLDILTFTDDKGKVVIRASNPELIGDNQANDEIISKVLKDKKPIESTQIISEKELIKEGKGLDQQARIKIFPTPKAEKLKKEYETSGMIMKAASPVTDENGRLLGVLYGGKLLNRNYTIVDKVINVVFKDEVYKGKKIGRATIFLDDVRISTNLENTDENRAVGTRVSEQVRERILEYGKPWIARAFAVDDWYITAYEPIRNIDNEIIGILGLGIIEQKYIDIKKNTLLTFFFVTAAGIIISLIIAYFLSHNITVPVKAMVSASKALAEGRMDSRVQCNSNDELGELGKAFNSMASSIKEREKKLKNYTKEEVMRSEKLATLGQLAASVAHEINNPLAVIMGRAEFLDSEIDDDDPIIQKSIKTIENESEKAASTVQRFLTFARQSEPELKLVNVNKLLDNSIGLASHLAIMEKVTLDKEFGGQIPDILIDPRQIEQVFINLILNAIQAMRAGGKLTVCSEQKDGIVEIRFSDTGSGISAENMIKIFNPFFTTKKAGTGLGLAICKQILEKHGGTIKIESDPGMGTTVYVTLPFKELKING